MNKTKFLKIGVFMLALIFLGLAITTLAQKKSDNPLEEYFELSERTFFQGKGSFSRVNEMLDSIVRGVKPLCKDEIDENGKVVKKAKFGYDIANNSFKVEMDESNGYIIAKGSVHVTYSKDCGEEPFLMGLVPDNGSIDYTFYASGKPDGAGSISTKLSSSFLPTSIKTNESWNAFISKGGDENSYSFFEKPVIKVDKFNFVAGVDARATLGIRDYNELDLIKYIAAEEPQPPTFVPPERDKMYTNGEDSQEFTLKAVTKVNLVNTADNNKKVENKEAGKKDVLFTVDMDIEPIERYSISRLHGETEGLPLMTDEDGYAKFTYTAPEVSDPDFRGANITFTAEASDERVKGSPQFTIELVPVVGKIEGRLVNFRNGKNFDYKAKIALAYPPGQTKADGSKLDRIELKGGTGEFSFETQVPIDNYSLVVDPDCPEPLATGKYRCQPRRLIKLPYNVDLGNIVIGTLDEYEKEFKRGIQDLFKGSGFHSLLGNYLNKVKIVYISELPTKKVPTNTWEEVVDYFTPDPVDSDSYAGNFWSEGGTVYISDPMYLMNLNDSQTAETAYHELFHAVHSLMGDQSWWYQTTKLGGEHNVWVESHERLAFDESLSHVFSRLAMINQGYPYKSTAYNDLSPSTYDALDGNITEGKVAGFLIDYYKYTKYTPSQIVGDLFNVLKSHGEVPGTNGEAAQTIQEWILTKMYMDPTDYKIDALMKKHNIVIDSSKAASWSNLISLKSTVNGRRTEAERKDSLEKYGQKVGDKGIRLPVPQNAPMQPNTYYKPTPNSDIAILPDGQAELGDNSKVVAANGAAVSTHNSMNVGLGTLFSVETKGEKTIVKVAKGQVEIFNTNTWESYTANPGEEVEVVDKEINKTALFDPKTDSDFQLGLVDWLYQYFNLVNAGIVLGVLIVLIIIFKIVKHLKNKGKIKSLMK